MHDTLKSRLLTDAQYYALLLLDDQAMQHLYLASSYDVIQSEDLFKQIFEYLGSIDFKFYILNESLYFVHTDKLKVHGIC